MRSPKYSLFRKALVYTTVAGAAMFATVALASVASRPEASGTATQATADTAAMAAARQLDGTSTGLTDAIYAAMSTPLEANKQTFDETGTPGTTRVIQIRFLSALPPQGDESPTARYLTPAHFSTMDPAKANYVEVTTETVTRRSGLLSIFGDKPAKVRASSIASRG